MRAETFQPRRRQQATRNVLLCFFSEGQAGRSAYIAQPLVFCRPDCLIGASASRT